MKSPKGITRLDLNRAASVSKAVILPFLLIITLQIFLGIFSLEVMTDIRAYTQGESRWSKAQKASVRALNVYAASGREDDYRQALRFLDVTQADHAARLGMDQAAPDYPAIRANMLKGGVRPDETGGMMWLYRNFGFVPDLRRAIAIWVESDIELDKLRVLAGQLQQQIHTDPNDHASVEALLARINQLDDTFTQLEEGFSAALGRAAAATQWALKLAILGTGFSLFVLGILYMRWVLAKNLQYQDMLMKNTERFNLALEGSNAGLWDWDIANDEIYCSRWIQRLLGYGDQDVKYSAAEFVQLVYPADRLRNRLALEAHLCAAAPYDIELRMCAKDGSVRWCRVLATASRDALGVPTRMVGSMSDITERREQDMALFAEKERAQVTLASIADAVIRTEMDGTISYLNKAAEKLLKCEAHQIRGRPLMEILHGVYDTNRQPIKDPVAQIVAGRPSVAGAAQSILLVRADGTEVAIDQSIAPIRDHTGATVGTVLVLHDISREREHAEQLLHQATHDELTGLLNRRAFQAQLLNHLNALHEGSAQHALLYLDLDQFKIVNDTCGHQAGDELIRQIGTILKARLRSGDCFARLGGDEFGIFLADCPPPQAWQRAEEIRRTVCEFRFVWRTKFFSVGVSIGLINFTARQFSLAELMSLADMACYVAKEKGRNRVHQHAGDDLELSARQGEMKWVTRLRDALDQQQFCLYAQPIVDLRSDQLPGAHIEILVRLQGEPNALIMPTAFLPSAERYNLMPSIDRWVVNQTFATLAKRQVFSNGVPIKTVAINLSGSSIGDPDFLAFVFEQQLRHKVPFELICFEITETAAVANLTDALHFIEALRARGCRFSLDDFGAGMSSFAYLKHLPVDYLKIDGGFIQDIANDPTDFAMVQAINTIGHLMKKLTIAEFVENQETLDILRTIGVDYVQGFILAKPEPFTAEFVPQWPRITPHSAL